MVVLLDTRNREPTAAQVEQSAQFASQEQARIAATPGAAVGKVLQLAARRGHDATSGLRRLRCRALVIGGEFDGVAPQPAVRALATLLPRSELREYGGGHLLLKFGAHEQAAWKAIGDFLLEEAEPPPRLLAGAVWGLLAVLGAGVGFSCCFLGGSRRGCR
jgi:pimeloyl-ACP methyl ester carboxylesterase